MKFEELNDKLKNWILNLCNELENNQAEDNEEETNDKEMEKIKEQLCDAINAVACSFNNDAYDFSTCDFASCFNCDIDCTECVDCDCDCDGCKDFGVMSHVLAEDIFPKDNSSKPKLTLEDFVVALVTEYYERMKYFEEKSSAMFMTGKDTGRLFESMNNYKDNIKTTAMVIKRYADTYNCQEVNLIKELDKIIR